MTQAIDHPDRQKYLESAAPWSGVSFSDWLILVEMEKLYKPNRVRITRGTAPGLPPWYFVHYNGICASYPPRSFYSFDAAKRYYHRIREYLGE